jgi:DsbC/DsbD-like thiol-disulfide interchange protein
MRRNSCARFAAATLLAGLIASPPASAQDDSPWVADLHAAMRLIAGAALTSDGAMVRRAGIEIRLDPGWKTYWRYPGDSGVPPSFDFAGSTNLKSVTVLWPAPQKFPDGAGGFSIGYTGGVVLPLRVMPQDAAKPTSLRVKAAYAVCEKLCVPAEAMAEIMLPGQPGSHEADLAAAEARVPRPVAPGTEGSLGIRSVHREGAGADARVVVAVMAPADARVELFVEGPTPNWALPLPEPIASPPGNHRFAFKLDGLPPGAHARGALLTITAVSGDTAIEVPAHLD